MKKLLLFLLAMCALRATWAYNFSAVTTAGQTLYYNIISGTTNVEVTYPGTDFYEPYYGYTEPTGDLEIPSTIANPNNGICYSVISIGDRAFRNCSSLTSVSIGNSVTSIGESAFLGCSSLSNVIIPNSVTSIGESAFNYCSSLTSVSIGNSVTSIGNNAFYLCSSLTSVTLPNSVTSIGNYAFFGCSFTSVTIGNSVISIGNYAFVGCSFTSVTIPNSVTNIGANVFSSCNNLKTVYNLSELTIGTTSYGLSANRVVNPNKSGNGDNAIYQIPDTYSFVDAEDNVETHIPRSTIPDMENLIYNDGGWKAKKIVLTDGQDAFNAPVAFTANEATYTREFTNTNRSTLYLPFPASIPDDLEVYDFSSFANNTLSFTEHSGNLAAYTPYLVGYDLDAKNTTQCTITANNVTFPKSETANYHPVTNGNMTFQGVLERTEMSSTSNYGYSNGYFVQSGGSAHVNPFRCYFTYSNAPAGAPPMLNVDIVDGEVGIEEAETIDTPDVNFYSTDVYDMMGRIVRRNAENLNGLPRGIYIWKGQKVVHINY